MGPTRDARCLACDDTTCLPAAGHPAARRGPEGHLDPDQILRRLRLGPLDRAVGPERRVPHGLPFVPGHEIAGVVAAVGADVEAFAVGDRVGVGCLVDSRQACGACDARDEHRCPGQVMTYASPDRHGRCGGSTPQTAGGYADRVVVQERFAIKIPAALPLEAAGPLMCAGTTAYAPLKRYGAGEGTRVGVVGLGGVGAMAVKLAKALGCEVTAISRSKKKAAAACKKFGADRAAVLGEAAALDLVIDTVPVSHDLAAVAPRPAEARAARRAPQSFAANYVDKLLGGTAPVTMSWIGGTACTRGRRPARGGRSRRDRVVPVSELPAVLEAIDAGNDAGRRYVLDLATLPAARSARPAFSAGAQHDAIGAAQLLSPSPCSTRRTRGRLRRRAIVFGLVVLWERRAGARGE
ncbi:sinapyl alcohol dehydrogenase [Aureococcus anophagefferens]|nr:sinapyl alcohol dehydrogenase [Aureococcus anophagefferens]